MNLTLRLFPSSQRSDRPTLQVSPIFFYEKEGNKKPLLLDVTYTTLRLNNSPRQTDDDIYYTFIYETKEQKSHSPSSFPSSLSFLFLTFLGWDPLPHYGGDIGFR